MINNQNINKVLEKLLIQILSDSVEVFREKFKELYENENKTDIEQCATDIYRNLEEYTKEYELTPQEKIAIEDKKLEVLKVIREHTQWNEIKKFIGIGLAILGATAAGVILALVYNSSSELSQIAENVVDIVE